MPTLFDKISQMQSPQVQASAQQRAQQVRQAATGKAGTGAFVPQSNIREQTAQSQVRQAERAQTMQERIQGQALSGQQQAVTEELQLGQEQLTQQGEMASKGMAAQGLIARQQIESQAELAGLDRNAKDNLVRQQIENNSFRSLAELASNYGITVNDIFSKFERSTQELDLRKDAAELEQLSFHLAMSDRAYLDELTRIGTERRLHDKHQFQKEITRTILGNKQAELLKQLGFNEELGQMQRDWNKEMANLGFEAKLELARAAIEQANQRQIWESGTEIVKAGVDYKIKDE